MGTDYKFCILTDEKDIIEYERQLFHAFSKRSPDGWIMRNYEIVDGNRLKSKSFTYEDQIISIVKYDGEIIAGNAVNLNIDKELFFEQKGFRISEDDRSKKIVDGLTVFVSDKIKGKDAMNIGFELFDFVIKKLKERGFIYLYGTCYKE